MSNNKTIRERLAILETELLIIKRTGYFIAITVAGHVGLEYYPYFIATLVG